MTDRALSPTPKGSADPAAAARDRRFAVVWHLAWAAVTAGAAAALILSGSLPPGAEIAALVAGFAAAMVGALLITADGPTGRGATLTVWCLAGASACLMTGGVGGPLAAWCLAPLAAATAFRRPDGLAMGAAASVAAAAVATLGAVLVPLPQVEPAARIWLSLLALFTVALGLGVGLISAQAVARRRLRVTQAAARRALDLLEGQRGRERELDQARISAEAQSISKSRFLANMSHELRTPLNAIMGFSDIMRQRLFGPVSDRYAEYAELIHESGSHLLELINDVLDMSKIEAERFELIKESFDAREAVSAVLRLMRGQADRAEISLRAVLPREALEADADRRAVKQIALNLISNALKFTPRGGAVTVTLEAEAEQLVLSVADTGMGIEAEDLARLGRPFEQAGDAGQKAGGAGLGLSLVRAFARLHGGDMTIQSVVGAGTTVTVRMPILIQDEVVEVELPRAAEA